MGFFPSTTSPPSMEIDTMNMISTTTSGKPKDKEIVETPSLGPHEALYHAIQSTYDAYVNDQHFSSIRSLPSSLLDRFPSTDS